MRLELRAHAAPWWGGVEFLARSTVNNHQATAEPLVMKERDPAICCEPTFRLSMQEAQTLMDDLWQCGLRPTEGSGSAGALAATEKHLNDMRRLVFDRGESHNEKGQR